MAGGGCFYHGMEIIKNMVMLTRWGEDHNNYQRVVAAQSDTEKTLQKLTASQTFKSHITKTLNYA